MEKNMRREPALYIAGSPERAEEIRHILEDEWGGRRTLPIEIYDDKSKGILVNSLGFVDWFRLDAEAAIYAIKNGWIKEYKLPEKPQFKPFDKVVARVTKERTWVAGFYSHYSEKHRHILTSNFSFDDCLPYNEQTEKLIGTRDEWKGGKE